MILKRKYKAGRFIQLDFKTYKVILVWQCDIGIEFNGKE